MDWPNRPPPSKGNPSMTPSRTAAWGGEANIKGRAGTADAEATDSAPQWLSNPKEGSFGYDYGLWSGRTLETNLTRQPGRPRSAPHAAEISHTSSIPSPAEVSFAGWHASSSSLIQSPALGRPKQGASAGHSFSFPQGETTPASWQAWLQNWMADKATTAVPGECVLSLIKNYEKQLDGLQTALNIQYSMANELQQQLAVALAAAAAVTQQRQQDQRESHRASQAAGSSEMALLLEQLRKVRLEKLRLQKHLTAVEQAQNQEVQKAREWQRLLTEANQLAKQAVDCSERSKQQLNDAKQEAAAARAASQSTAEQLQQELVELSSQLQEAVQAKAAAESSSSALVEQLEAMNRQLQQQQDAHRRELEVALATNDHLTRDHIVLSNKIQRLEGEKSAAQHKCNDLTARLREITKAFDRFQDASQPNRLGPLSSMRWLVSTNARANSQDAITARQHLLTEVRRQLPRPNGDGAEADTNHADDRLVNRS